MTRSQMVASARSLGLAFGFSLTTLSRSVFAQTPEDSARAGVGGGDPAQVTNLASTVVGILTFVVGALAVIFVIIGGLKYVTSGGDASKTQSARSTIIYALVGLVVAIFARVIVNFVLTEA